MSNERKNKITRENYVDEAENVIKALSEKDKLMSTSKLRNILSLVSDLKTDAQHSREDELNNDLKSRVQYLKMRIAYEVGRDPERKPKKNRKGKIELFVENAGLQEIIEDIRGKRDNLLLFCDYMEALTAYHKFYYAGDEN